MNAPSLQADDLKAMGAPQEANWHFIDIPVVDPAWTGTPVPVPSADTNPWAITAGHSTVYDKKSAYLDKARQLRFLVHLVGDIHQPLHAAAYFSDQFPTGDAGGNLWPVAGVDYTTELHAVWDSGAGLWVDDLVRPLNSSGQAWIDSMTQSIIAQYPVSALQPYIKVSYKDMDTPTCLHVDHEATASTHSTAHGPTPCRSTMSAPGLTSPMLSRLPSCTLPLRLLPLCLLRTSAKHKPSR